MFYLIQGVSESQKILWACGRKTPWAQCTDTFGYLFISRGNLESQIHITTCFWEVGGNTLQEEVNYKDATDFKMQNYCLYLFNNGC